MRTAGWLAMCLAVGMAAAQLDDSLHTRVKRRGIIFPGAGPVTDHALELPENMDLNAMDLGSLSRINSIDNITAFADLFGIPLPEDSLGFDLSTRFGGGAEQATMAKCKPEMQTVELDLPVQSNTLFYPTCVRVEQCGGCCYGPLLTCRPTATSEVALRVLKTVTGSSGDGRRRLKRQRRRRQTTNSYHDVTVIKHDACECGCVVQQKDCNPAIHTYRESECACVCTNRDEKARCEQENDTKYWDNDSCTCFCRRPVDCSTGEFFSQASCRCERP